MTRLRATAVSLTGAVVIAVLLVLHAARRHDGSNLAGRVADWLGDALDVYELDDETDGVVTDDTVRRALQDVWSAVHAGRFATDVPMDTVYVGTRRAERAIGEVAERYGVGYYELRSLGSGEQL